MRFGKTEILDQTHGGLIVSCQAYADEPMRDPRTMAQVARSAVAGGAAAIRLEGIDDIREAAGLPVPIIGLWKVGDNDVFITPTLAHARAVADAGADIVALDGTRRPRPDGRSLAETVRELRVSHDALIMADCGSLDDAREAERAGVDIIGTTLAGYTGERETTEGPDLELVREIAAESALPLIAEGRVHSPAQAVAALNAGAFAVCVGTAITHPATITGWFTRAIDLRSLTPNQSHARLA